MNTWPNTIFRLTLSNGEVYKAYGLGGLALFQQMLKRLTIKTVQALPSAIEGMRFLYVSRPDAAWAEAYGIERYSVMFAETVTSDLLRKMWGYKGYHEWLTAEEIGQEMGGN